MPSYTTLAVSGRTRILRVAGDDPAVAITTCDDADLAGRIRKALDSAGGDVPHLAASVLAATGVELPEPADWEYNGADRGDWLTQPAVTEPLDVTRRALSVLDAPNPEHRVYVLEGIAAALTDAPESVRRAVRDEIAVLLAPYDGVPVVGYVYDYKWNECSWSLLLNGALNQLTDDELRRVLPDDFGLSLDVLDRRRDVDVPAEVDTVAESGHLSVDVHPQQLAAWLAHHRPHLATGD